MVFRYLGNMNCTILTVKRLKYFESCKHHNYQNLFHTNTTGDVSDKTEIQRFLLPISLQFQISFSTVGVYELSSFSLDLIRTHALSSPSLSPFLCHTSSPLLHTHAFLSVLMVLTEIWRHNSFHCKASKPPQNDYLTLPHQNTTSLYIVCSFYLNSFHFSQGLCIHPIHQVSFCSLYPLVF